MNQVNKTLYIPLYGKALVSKKNILLRDLKAECADNLWIADSAKFLKWMTWYCDSWDAEIIELREKVNQLSKKSYEGLM